MTERFERLTQPFFDTGDGGGDPGGDPDGSWLDSSEYIKGNPEAKTHFSKYADLDAALKGSHETAKKLGSEVRIPDDPSKLTDEQKASISKQVRSWDGGTRPDAPENFTFTLPEGVQVHEETMGEFRSFLHERGISQEDGQAMLDLHGKMMGALHQQLIQQINTQATKNAEQFLQVDCQGEKAVYDQKIMLVENFLKEFAVNENGQKDPKVWEGFKARMTSNDRYNELILLRALTAAAQHHKGTGGAPGGQPPSQISGGALNYPEMG